MLKSPVLDFVVPNEPVGAKLLVPGLERSDEAWLWLPEAQTNSAPRELQSRIKVTKVSHGWPCGELELEVHRRQPSYAFELHGRAQQQFMETERIGTQVGIRRMDELQHDGEIPA